MTLDIDQLKLHLGRAETRADDITRTPAAALAAVLEVPAPARGEALPPMWQLLYFLPLQKQSEMPRDGSQRGMLPEVTWPRRMWAGSRMRFLQPLKVGDPVERTSTLASVDLKQGRSGDLLFVSIHHEYRGAAGLLMQVDDSIVYRPALPPGTAHAPLPGKPAPADAAWEATAQPDEIMLFRYSALTFNAHRIHYDRPYAMQEEGYPGLVVHGPLIATLLLEQLRRQQPAAAVSAFEFRSIGPLFDTAPFALCGRPAPDGRSVALWAKNSKGELAMEAQAELA
jgi:3-methylfumaryl-CoA hydratase